MKFESFTEFAKSLNACELASYAEACGTTRNYMRVHLIPAKKVPRRPLMALLAEKSNGAVDMDMLTEHFYGRHEKNSRAIAAA